MRIGVFAKAPVPGEVKTRLVPLLGADGAAGLHAGLVRHALDTARRSGVGPVELWCAPDCEDAFLRRCAGEFGARLREQSEGDLGERMARAFDAVRGEGDGLVLIGSDAPALTPRHLQQAAEALREADAVVVPAEDGGYVLIGLSAALPAVFQRVDWSTGAVMAQTRARLREARATWRELDTLWDVDRPGDYARLQREGLLQEVLS